MGVCSLNEQEQGYIWVEGGEDYHPVTLYTRKDFGCNQHVSTQTP